MWRARDGSCCVRWLHAGFRLEDAALGGCLWPLAELQRLPRSAASAPGGLLLGLPAAGRAGAPAARCLLGLRRMRGRANACAGVLTYAACPWRRYLAFGSSMDYMYSRLHVRYPLTFEVGCGCCLATCAHSLEALMP